MAKGGGKGSGSTKNPGGTKGGSGAVKGGTK